MDIPLFRQTFPEFSDNTVYTDVIITFWSDLAECEINQDRFGCAYTAAVNLYTAHNISIAAQNENQSSFVLAERLGQLAVRYRVNLSDRLAFLMMMQTLSLKMAVFGIKPFTVEII
jgi:hypothetical protein